MFHGTHLVVHNLPDDLLNPTTHAVEHPIEAPLHGESTLGAVALCVCVCVCVC